MIINVTVSGNTLSGVCLYPGNEPHFQIYAGDPTFLHAQPTSNTTFATSNGYCYAWRGDNVQPRGIAIRMEGKINSTCDRLTLTYWTLKHNSTQWVAGTETLGSTDFVRYRGTVPSSTPASQPPRVNITNPRLTPTLPMVPPTTHSTPTTPATTPATSPSTTTHPDSTTPGAAPPKPDHGVGAFLGIWQCDTLGRIQFKDYGGGRVRGDFLPGANAKGYFDGTVSNGVFTGVENIEYFGEKFTARIILKLEPDRPYVFRGDWTTPDGKTGYYNGVKAD